MIGNGKNIKSIAYVKNVADFLTYLLKYDRGYRLFNYSDKPELIQDFLFASIIDFVENEPVYDIDWLSDKKRKEIWSKIDKSYKFAKYTLPARKKRMKQMLSESYNEEHFMEFVDKPENPIIKELSALEKQTETEIQQNHIEIVKIRQYLRT